MNGYTLNNRNIMQGFSDDRVIHITYGNLIPGNYEKQVIFGNKCPAFVGMRCIFDVDRADVFYITGGLSTFEEYVRKHAVSTQDLLRIILEVVKSVRECGDYLIAENELNLKEERIFFNGMDGSARIMYMPGFRRESVLGIELAALTERTEKLSRLGMLQKDILRDFCRMAVEAGSDVRAIIAAAEEAVRKTYIPYKSIQETEDEAEESSAKVKQQEKNENSTSGGVIKRHIREFLNELVS